MTTTRLVATFACLLGLNGCAGFAGFNSSHPVSSGVPAAPGSIATADSADFYLDIVSGLVKQKRNGAAIAFLDSYAGRKKALTPRYWLMRGDALTGLGRYKEANTAYSSLKNTALAAQGWNGIGRVAAAARQWNAAAGYFQLALTLSPSNPDFLNNHAFVMLHLGNTGAALVQLRQASELDPASSLIRTNLIIALTLQGARTEADAQLASIKDPDQRTTTRAAVQVAIAGGDFIKADRS